MSRKIFIIARHESDLPPRYWKYLRLLVLAWSNRSNGWTKKTRARHLAHAEKLRKHVGWMCKRDWPEYKQWRIESMGSKNYMDLFRQSSLVKFLLILE
ncbi:hypothetical protein MIF8_14 [Erwinia phage MIF8]